MTAYAKLLALFVVIFPSLSFAASSVTNNIQQTGSSLGIICVIVFAISYILVMSEEFIHLRKSKSVIMASGIIWILVAELCRELNLPHAAELAVRHNLLEYVELFLFLLVAMTYVNAMQEREVFNALRCWLIRKNFSFRKLFWITGILSFFISPIADNLTTALLMCAVVLAMGGKNSKFISLSCINIVIAANAGGASSPFGDITTLMVWQKGHIPFFDFFKIFVPATLSFIVPAAVMHFFVPQETPTGSNEIIALKPGAKRIIALFFLTIATAVCFHNFFHLPPTIGMMTGLGYLMMFAYYLRYIQLKYQAEKNYTVFDIFRKIERAEWDTLMFFYGVILCVGGLSTIGYLEVLSHMMYTQWGAHLSAAYAATPANIAVGVISAIIDNIPVMFAILTMNPTLSEGQWLLVTLTTGIGGSMLSIGSAAGVALMGQARGHYTFFSHLKWTPVIALGYLVGVGAHLWLNSHTFTVMP